MTKTPTCELCGEPMPPGEEMFKYHGYSGPCPKPPKLERVREGTGAAKMTERDELVERVANILENMPECHGLSSVKILALTRVAIAECEKYRSDLISEACDRDQTIEQLTLDKKTLAAQCAAMRAALERVCAAARSALSPDAGKKVLDVVRAVGEWRDLFEPGAVEATVKIDAERRILMALSALGWKP